jgi:hypothetical protein
MLVKFDPSATYKGGFLGVMQALDSDFRGIG